MKHFVSDIFLNEVPFGVTRYVLGKLYRYDYRFGYDLLLTEENSIERKLNNYGQAEWEDEEYEP